MGNLGWPEMLALGVIALIVLGPERLPKYAADAARLLRQLRRMATDATSDLRADLGPEMADLRLSDLSNPRRMVARYLLDEESAAGVAGAGPAGRAGGEPSLAAGERPPYDADAT